MKNVLANRRLILRGGGGGTHRPHMYPTPSRAWGMGWLEGAPGQYQSGPPPPSLYSYTIWRNLCTLNILAANAQCPIRLPFILFSILSSITLWLQLINCIWNKCHLCKVGLNLLNHRTEQNQANWAIALHHPPLQSVGHWWPTGSGFGVTNFLRLYNFFTWFFSYCISTQNRCNE